MIRLVLAFVLALLATPALADPADGLQSPITVQSKFVPARTVQVWLPPDYWIGHRRYPVLYMHDGQNIFEEPAPFSGQSWHVQKALARLIAERRVRPAIIVGIWNTDNRLGEYMPEAALADAPEAKADATAADFFRRLPVDRAHVAGDAYLRFLVEELKPLIDARYRTLTGPKDTMLMGSSMGGLISAYAVTRYPHVFGAAACLSTSWPIGGGFAERWYEAHLPPASTRLYFDYGTGTNDGAIEPFQRKLDAAAHRDARHWTSRAWPGDAHTESAWARRVDVPLLFLLGRGGAARP